MYTSDIENNNKRAQKCALVYLIVSIFCAFFGGVYEVFGHGVYSFHMIYAFGFPLALGALPFVIISRSKLKVYPVYASLSCYHLAIATATVGCILQGALDIYGTTSVLMIIYPYVSVALFSASIVIYLIQIFKNKKSRP